MRSWQQEAGKENHQRLCDKFEEVKNDLPHRTKRAVDLETEKGASSWLTVLPIKDIYLTLNKRESGKDAIHLRYDWDMNGILSPGLCLWRCIIIRLEAEMSYKKSLERCCPEVSISA